MKISPSMICADIGELRNTLRIFEECGIEYLHIDVMDGVFVPNLQLGTDYVKQLRRLSSIPLDIHLMIERPEDKLDWFDFQPRERVAVHPESTKHLQRTLQKIRDKGASPLAALNPATPLSALDWVWDDIDAVLLMTVNPGFAGQKLVPQTIGKIQKCRELADSNSRAGLRAGFCASGQPSLEIEVDGNVNFETAPKMSAAGAGIYVIGSGLFNEPDLAAAIKRYREVV
jgi:ribulose-phosphate 3-epimerase